MASSNDISQLLAPEHAATPPQLQLAHLLSGSIVTHLIAVAAELGIADLVSDQPQDVGELAASTGTDPNALYRVLRALASINVFTEIAPRRFGLTPLATTLQAGIPGSMREMARLYGRRESALTLAELNKAIRTGRPSFDQVHGTDLWSYLAKDPESGKIFHAAMGNVAHQLHATLVNSCDLSDVHRLIDVGGGHGHLMATVLQRYPYMRGVVFDQSHVVAKAEQVLTEAGVRNRVELVDGDFFLTVPKGGDAYILSWILHDWDDPQATSILTNIRSAMDPNGQVLVIDAVLPESNAPHYGKLMDIMMLTLLGGRERTEHEFAILLAAAGLRHVETRTMSGLSDLIIAHCDNAEPMSSATGSWQEYD